MKAQIRFRPPIIALSSLVILVMASLSIFFFTRIDNIVHGDLYRYGLQFSYEWAGPYWNYSRLIRGFLEFTLLIAGASIILALLQMRRPEIHSAKITNSILLSIAIVMFASSMYFFNRLDEVVHVVLYRYGLQFSHEWAGPYWNYARLIPSLLGAAIGTSGISIMYISISTPTREISLLPSPHTTLHRRRRNPTKLICYILTSAGIIALAVSINYNSSILAFIGLGLLFWGVILFYIRPGNYIKQTLLDKTTLPSLTNLNQIIELGYKGKAVYLPPRYFKSFESSKVYINAGKDIKLPSPEKIQDEEDEVVIDEPSGVLITPLGLELKRLFEKTLDTNFTKVDLQYLEQNMPKLLVEDLEIAQEVELETKGDRVFVKMKNSIYRSICEEAKKLPIIHCSLGCPLCSAIACTLAEVTGKSVAIEKDQISDDGQTTTIEYRLLEPKAEHTQK